MVDEPDGDGPGCARGVGARAGVDDVAVAVVPRGVGDLEHDDLERRGLLVLGPGGEAVVDGQRVEDVALGADLGEGAHRPERTLPGAGLDEVADGVPSGVSSSPSR